MRLARIERLSAILVAGLAAQPSWEVAGLWASPSPIATADPAPGAAPADTIADADLAATTSPPWVPGRPMPSGEAWETALRAPGRVVTLPLSALGYVTQRTFVTIEETNVIPKVLLAFSVLPQAGLTVGPASLGDRTGFGVSVGIAPPGVRRILTANWDGSTLNYNRTRVTARYGPAQLEYAYEWRPQDRFYGLGPHSSQVDTSSYATQGQRVRLGLTQRITRGTGAQAPRWDFAGWFGPREIITRHGRDDELSFEERFPSLLPFLDRRFEHLVYGARVALDHRRGQPHWSGGGRTSVEVERFDRPLRALAFRTGHVPFQFTRWTYEAEGGFSFYRDPRTVRLWVRVVDNVPDASGAVLPVDMARLGGSRGLNGFEPGRFHDLDALVGRLSYVFPLANRLEFDVHADAGSVYADVWRDAKASTFEHSFGVALRPRLDNVLLGAMGVEWSREATRFHFSIGGVE